MTLASRAITQLASWPDLTEAPPSCSVGRALCSAQGQIAHFHSERDVDLHLTARAIRRFEDHLEGSSAVRTVQGSGWVTIRLDHNVDVDLLLTLMSLALQAHRGRPGLDDPPSAQCNDSRATARPRENAGEF